MKRYVGCIPPFSQTAFVRSDFKNLGDFAISLLFVIFSKAHYFNGSIEFYLALRHVGKLLRSGVEGKLSKPHFS